MICYLVNIIVYSIDLDLRDSPSEPAFILPSTKGAEADNKFCSRLYIDSNIIASKKYVYLLNYNITYFKYSQKGYRLESCRFEILQEL
jgi:hypothetical protein